MEDISEKIVKNQNVKTVRIHSAKIGVLQIIQILLETSDTIPGRTQLITNIPIKTPSANGVSASFVNNNTLFETCFYIDNYPASNGGISLVNTASIPSGSYRGTIVLITK